MAAARRLSLGPGPAAVVLAVIAAAASVCVVTVDAESVTRHSGCKSDADCSLNGVCTSGQCACDPAWTGDSCATLNLLPTNKTSGYVNINVGSPPQNTSSWGGTVLYDEKDDVFYMWATELGGHCGMHTWTTNSQTIIASSKDPFGPYLREGVQFPVWSHEVGVVRGPKGEYVAFFSYENPCTRPYCNTCTDGTTDPACTKSQAPFIEDEDPTYMSWAPCATCSWSEPQVVLMKKPQMDTNMAAVIHSDGTLVGMWRDHKPGGKHSTPHIVTATNWTDPSTYSYNEDALFPDVGGAIEDMHLYRDARGNYHCLFHQMFDCDNCGGHAYSADGLHWTWTGTCYTAKTQFTDGTEFQFPNCERPHMVFDKTGTKPIALTNGVKNGFTQGMANNDQSYTLLRPIQQ